MKKIFLSLVVFLMAAPVVFAQPYAPGNTLDPTCGPSAVNCYVQFATNGLTQSLSGIGLGGTLTGATTIDQNTNNLSFTNGSVGIGTAANASYGLVTLGTYLNTSSIAATPTGGNLQITNNTTPFFGNVLSTVPFAGTHFANTDIQIDNGVVFSPLLNEVVGGMYSNDFTNNLSHAVEVYSRGARMASTDNGNLTSTIEVGPSGATISGKDTSLVDGLGNLLTGTLGLSLNNSADKVSLSYQNGATYSFPNTDGGEGYVMVNGGSNAMSWKSIRQYADNPTPTDLIEPIASGIGAIALGGTRASVVSYYSGTSYPGISNTEASGAFAVSLGMSNVAFGSNSFATGFYTRAMQWGASSFGIGTQALLEGSFVAGINSVASGYASAAFGQGSIASGSYSLVTGLETQATNQSSVALGFRTTASGDSSFPMGNSNTASGANAVALGLSNQATGARSFVFGNAIKALAVDEIVFGTVNTDYAAGFVPTVTAASTDRRFTVATGTGGFPFDAFTILRNGKVGVGINNFETTSSSSRLQVSGSIDQTGAVNCSLQALAGGTIQCVPSDERLKKDITDMSYGLSTVLALRPVTYTFKDTEKFGTAQKIGFLAQDLERSVPEVVTEGPDYKSVSYGDLVAVLVNAIKELSQKIDQIASNITTRFLRTDTLCVGNACVTESEFLHMMQQSSVSTVVTTPTPVTPVIPDSSESTSTTTTGPVVDPIDTVAVTSETVPADSAISTPEPVVN